MKAGLPFQASMVTKRCNSDSSFYIINSGFWIVASTFSILASTLSILDSGLYILNSGFWILIVRDVASKGTKLPIIATSPLQALYMVA